VPACCWLYNLDEIGAELIMNRLLRRKPDREPYAYFDNSCTGVYDSAWIAGRLKGYDSAWTDTIARLDAFYVFEAEKQCHSTETLGTLRNWTQALATRIRSLYANRALCDSMGAIASLCARERFNQETYGREVEDVLRHVVS
jgi:hypothetical protein